MSRTVCNSQTGYIDTGSGTVIAADDEGRITAASDFGPAETQTPLSIVEKN